MHNKMQYGNSHCYTLQQCDEEQIKELLMFRKIVNVEHDILYLDNGIELRVSANEGCPACSSGWYSITELKGYDNAITNVELVCDDKTEEGYGDTSYKIFVYAENKQIKVLQVDGSDGNGYYGTGYTIQVKVPR